MRRGGGYAGALAALLILPAAPLLAQDEPEATPDTGPEDGPKDGPEDGRLVIDLTQNPPLSEEDQLAIDQCEDEADAARIAGEIVVCRQLGETSDGSYNHEDFIRRYAEATQGPKTPDVDGTGLPGGMAPLVTIRGCFIPPCPPPPALIIDVEALPDAPPGSDADRIARGLPPLGEEGDEGRNEPSRPISEEELGLPEPAVRTP